MLTGNFQIYKLGFKKTGTRDQIANMLDPGESKGVSEKHVLIFHWLC